MEGKSKRFFLFIPENPWYLLLTICNYSSVWHHQLKGWCWLSGIACEWRGRLHPYSWILFAGSFLGCQQRFIPGSLIKRQDGGRGEEGSVIQRCHLIFTPPTHFSLHHSAEQQHVTSQVCSPNQTARPTIHLFRPGVSSATRYLSVAKKSHVHCHGFTDLYQPTVLTSNRYQVVFFKSR